MIIVCQRLPHHAGAYGLRAAQRDVSPFRNWEAYLMHMPAVKAIAQSSGHIGSNVQKERGVAREIFVQ